MPLIILHDSNPLRMLDAELTLRSLVKPDIEIRTLANPAEVSALLNEARALLALLDGDAADAIYALHAPDPRIVWMRERLDRAPVRSGPVILKPLRSGDLRALSQFKPLLTT